MLMRGQGYENSRFRCREGAGAGIPVRKRQQSLPGPGEPEPGSRSSLVLPPLHYRFFFLILIPLFFACSLS